MHGNKTSEHNRLLISRNLWQILPITLRNSLERARRPCGGSPILMGAGQKEVGSDHDVRAGYLRWPLEKLLDWQRGHNGTEVTKG